jgi:hypothetical protein
MGWRRRAGTATAGLALALTVSAQAVAEPPSRSDASNVPLAIPPYEAARLCLIRINADDFAVCRGPFREEVKTQDFYVLVGRQDLADKDSRRQLALDLTVGGGLAASLVGLVTLALPLASDGPKVPWQVTVGLIGGGLVIAGVGDLTFRGPTITPDQATGLIDLYNSRIPGAPPERKLREARLFGMSGTF